MAVNAPDAQTVGAPEVETPTHKRTVGPVTTAGGAGSAFGGSLATLLIALFGLDLTPEATGALVTVVTTLSLFIGGYLVPSRRATFEAEMAAALTMTQTEKEELVQSAARSAAYISTPDYGALIDQALAARELSAPRPAETQPVPDPTPAVADAGNGLAMYALNEVDATDDAK